MTSQNKISRRESWIASQVRFHQKRFGEILAQQGEDAAKKFAELHAIPFDRLMAAVTPPKAVESAPKPAPKPAITVRHAPPS